MHMHNHPKYWHGRYDLRKVLPSNIRQQHPPSLNLHFNGEFNFIHFILIRVYNFSNGIGKEGLWSRSYYFVRCCMELRIVSVKTDKIVIIGFSSSERDKSIIDKFLVTIPGKNRSQERIRNEAICSPFSSLIPSIKSNYINLQSFPHRYARISSDKLLSCISICVDQHLEKCKKRTQI